MMFDSHYVAVRRSTNKSFRVLPDDLVSEDPRGYDLDLVRSVATEGLDTPITVRPMPDGRFRVVDGLKRLAAIRVLTRVNKPVFDAFRGLMRPAGRVFSLICCRVAPSDRSGETPSNRPGL